MKKDVKRMKKRGKDMSKLTTVLNLLSSGTSLPDTYDDHSLSGTLKDFRECHIEPDWLLMYKKEEDTLLLIAAGTGSHSDLFGI